MDQDTKRFGRPYCGNCGYELSGLTDSSRCPECGGALVDVLVRGGFTYGKRYTSRTTLFGLPLLSIALGATATERVGRARGVLAIGDRAVGLIAMGGRARGVVAMGGVAIGCFSFGGVSIGLVTAVGGCAIGGMVWGGVGLGVLVSAGLAIGFAASGGMAVGIYAVGGLPLGLHRVGPGVNDPAVGQLFRHLTWFFGPPGFAGASLVQPLIATAGATLAASGVIGLLAAAAHWLKGRSGRERGAEGA